jgi:rsbT antagonist protein RsbS
MPNGNGTATHPALVSILRQGTHLIASIHTALDDSQLIRFQHDLIDRVGRDRARGIIIDVGALDVLDSFGTRTLRNIAQMANLRGARTVIVGINPDVAFAMVELGTDLGGVLTALDLEEGLDLLNAVTGAGQPRPRSTEPSTGGEYTSGSPDPELLAGVPRVPEQPRRTAVASRL